jgi:hypothetical protein
MLTAELVELNAVQVCCLFGMLCHEYQQHPEAIFWDILQKFNERKIQANIPVIGAK